MSLSAILTVISWFAIILALFFLLLCFACKRMIFKPSKLVEIPRGDIPEYLLPCFEAALPLLEGLGFTYRRSFYCTPMANHMGARNVYGMEFIHPESGAMAAAGANLNFSTKYQTEFVSLFEDGDIWSTINGIKHLLPPGNTPGYTYFDDYLPDDSRAWQAHLTRVTGSGKTIVKNEEAIENRMKHYDERIFEARVRQGYFYPLKKEGFFRLTWKGAFCWVLNINIGKTKERGVNRKIIKTALPKEAELEVLESQKEFQQALDSESNNAKAKAIVSAALFVAVGVYFFDAQFSLILLAVLALHEGGHWLAMKCFGHSNVAVYFIPLLGALTIGENKIKISPMKQFMIFLAGPLPGLLLGLIAWEIAINVFPRLMMPPNLYALIITFSVVNYFNLIPLFPLDGGRIVETFLLSRMPRLRFCFVIFSVMVLCLLTLFYTFFSIIGAAISAFLIFIFVPTQWRLLKLRLAVGKAEAISEGDAREMIVNALSTPKFEKWNAVKRFYLSDIMISELINPKPGLIQIIYGGIVYGLCLYLPFLIESYIKIF